MYYNVKHIGAIMRKAREAKFLTQAELSEKIKVSSRTIIAIEGDKRKPTFYVLYRLIRFLDIPADFIFRSDDERIRCDINTLYKNNQAEIQNK